MAQIAPLYAKITNPRTTDGGTGSLPSIRDLYKGLSLSSQFKVSLFLNRNNRDADNLDGHLTRCGIFDEYSASSYSYDFFASEAILPGANFDMTEQPGSYQGMLEYAPTRRIWPDFEVSYYIDKNYNLLRLFEEWMNYINPLYSNDGKYIGGSAAQVGFTGHNSYYRMKYPGKYKRTIAITKFERDFWENPNEMQAGQIPQQMISYQLIDAFPKQVTAVPVTYDGSTVTKVTVIFGYTRYITHKGNGNKTSPYGSTENTGKNRNYRVNRYLPPSITFDETSGDTEETVTKSGFNPFENFTLSKEELKEKYGDVFMGTNIDDIGKGFYNTNFSKDNTWSWKKFKSKHLNFDFSKPPSNWNIKDSTNPSK